MPQAAALASDARADRCPVGDFLAEIVGIDVTTDAVDTLAYGSRYKRVNADQLDFKHEADPMGLLNPGKMRSFAHRPD